MRHAISVLCLFLIAATCRPAALTAQEHPLVSDPGVVSYTFRHQFEEDVPGTLDLIKEMGFDHVEFSNLFGKSASELRELLDERGLTCTSYGVGYDALVENTDRVIREAQTLGAAHVRVAWIPHDAPFDVGDARRAVRDFNRAGQVLKENGLQLSYHNHGYEFRPHGGGTLFDYIAEHTDPEYVSFEMDAFWVAHPGHDPVALLEKYPDRFSLMHLKDLRKGVEGDYSGRAPSEYDVPLGTGQVDFPALLRAAHESGVEYVYIEDESDDVISRVPRSREYILSLRHDGHVHGHSHGHSHRVVDYGFRSDASEYQPPEPDDEGYYWWKGNLHTHTVWSDGDQFPEVVAQWYYEHGYHFLAISDHNILMRGEKWIDPETYGSIQSGGGTEAYELYRERFGDDWIETREKDGELEVRLKPLSEIRTLFDEPGRFLMIESEEITEPEHVVHVNATNILEFIEPQSGPTVEETIRLNVDAVAEQRERTGQRMIPHLNHPNFRRAITAEDMIPVENMRFFEVYNGHRGVLNFGEGAGVKDLDRLWDIILTRRLGEMGLDPVYGLAVDDAHHYEGSSQDVARPGRGWVEVRSRYLTPDHIVRALERGDFYASTGVRIDDVYSDGQRYVVQIEPEEDVEYTVQFIGTRRGYDASSEPFVDEEGRVRHDRTRNYSQDIGEVLQESAGSEAVYEYDGDELYVRAKVISSKPKANYFVEGEREQAWLQPYRPGDVTMRSGSGVGGESRSGQDP